LPLQLHALFRQILGAIAALRPSPLTRFGLLARVPYPNRGEGGFPTAKIVMIGTKQVVVMTGGGYVYSRLGRLISLCAE
jgi:hypothetical protein